ncbi:hypothetical protein JD292_03210 [Leucobacter sp. CSA2]|uniref:Uncharacterized protein n=1 Tax=Leucobacter edaphi TaxID=2796472 RepID=A0A934QC22_9MICO|nr:hypothetical protein [Leucobacter edaphi]MBK0421090.1 hypothetical protein [Leucobacter edaphi]
MNNVIAAILVCAFFIAARIWKFREDLRHGKPSRDETLRAGGPELHSPERAARRAQGTTAWTRISGP